jgi:hypothetical protein
LQGRSDAKEINSIFHGDGGEQYAVPICSKKRKAMAAELTQHIKSKHVKPSDLSHTVIPSGLVSQDRLLEAFQAQALVLEKKNATIPNIKRLPCWDHSSSASYRCENDHTTNVLLHCEPMIFRIHVWRIKINKASETSMWLDEIGVAASTIQFPGKVWQAPQIRAGFMIAAGVPGVVETLSGMECSHCMRGA